MQLTLVCGEGAEGEGVQVSFVREKRGRCPFLPACWSLVSTFCELRSFICTLNSLIKCLCNAPNQPQSVWYSGKGVGSANQTAWFESQLKPSQTASSYAIYLTLENLSFYAHKWAFLMLPISQITLQDEMGQYTYSTYQGHTVSPTNIASSSLIIIAKHPPWVQSTYGCKCSRD